MIVIRVFGGLGNQMFQYAFYEYMKQNNSDVLLDLSDFSIHNHHHGYELDNVFDLEYEVVNERLLKTVRTNKESLLLRLIQHLFHIELRSNRECNGHHHYVKIENVQISEDVYFDGYWQNVCYLEPIRDKLISSFRFKKHLTGQNLQLAQLIDNTESVSVHVRRGDYLNNSKLSDVCNIEYYKHAVKICEEKSRVPLQYIVFSDDIDWVKKTLKLKNNTIYVDWNIEQDSYIDMELMQLCKYHIIANSTFSWWPAWLDNKSNKTVIMPRDWFKGDKSTRLHIKDAILI